MTHWRGDAYVLAAIAIVLRLPAFVAGRSLVFDDGVYAASALAMRAGEAPFRTVFSGSGPLFLPLVWLGDLVGFRTVNAPRVVAVASGVVVTLATYSCARRLTTRSHALFAAGLVTTSGSVLWVTGPVNADGPALAGSLLAVAFALRYRARPSVGAAVFVGFAAGAAASIKALAVPALVAAGVLLLLPNAQELRSRVRAAGAAAGIAIGVYFCASLPWGISRVWDQSFTYHEQSARENTHAGAARKIVTTLWDRDVVVVVALALAAAAMGVAWVSHRAARAETPFPRISGEAGGDRLVVVAVLLGWVLLVVALLVWEPALFKAHVAHLVAPLVLLACLRPPPWSVLAAAGLIVAPFWVLANDGVLWPAGYGGHAAAVVERLGQLPGDALVIADDPGLAWRSGHRPPGPLVDTSFLRIEQGQITERSVAGAASAATVCAVVSSLPRHFPTFHGLGDRLRAEGYQERRYGPGITLYVGPRCGGS
jgi:hypothetical protein